MNAMIFDDFRGPSPPAGRLRQAAQAGEILKFNGGRYFSTSRMLAGRPGPARLSHCFLILPYQSYTYYTYINMFVK